MKTRRIEIELPEAEADALERAVMEWGFASPVELARAAIEEFLAAPSEYDPEQLERDIAEHEAAKARGEPALTVEEVRALLRDAAASGR